MGSVHGSVTQAEGSQSSGRTRWCTKKLSETRRKHTGEMLVSSLETEQRLVHRLNTRGKAGNKALVKIIRARLATQEEDTRGGRVTTKTTQV